MSIVVIGNVFVDVKGFPENVYLPTGRNAGKVVTVHGGVGRNVAEDIANLELRPVFVSAVDDTAQGEEVKRKLINHKVNTAYLPAAPDSMGMWLAVFDHKGDLAGSISKRPNCDAIRDVLDEKGDEIFKNADSIIVEIDIDKDIVKRIFKYAEQYSKPVYAVVANMSIASQRRDFLQSIDCFICNVQEAGILFVDDFTDKSPEEMRDVLSQKVMNAKIPSMIVTMGSQGAVYANIDGEKGYCPAEPVLVRDTTGAGDAFCAGAAVGLTYGKSMEEAVKIGTHLAASVIGSSENVCPRFQPREFGIEIDVAD